MAPRSADYRAFPRTWATWTGTARAPARLPGVFLRGDNWLRRKIREVGRIMHASGNGAMPPVFLSSRGARGPIGWKRPSATPTGDLACLPSTVDAQLAVTSLPHSRISETRHSRLLEKCGDASWTFHNGAPEDVHGDARRTSLARANCPHALNAEHKSPFRASTSASVFPQTGHGNAE